MVFYSAALLVYLRLIWRIYMTDEIKTFDIPEQMNTDTFIFVSEFLQKREIFTKKLVAKLKVFHIKMLLRCTILFLLFLSLMQETEALILCGRALRSPSVYKSCSFSKSHLPKLCAVHVFCVIFFNMQFKERYVPGCRCFLSVNWRRICEIVLCSRTQALKNSLHNELSIYALA